jgi:Flp pilus assembly protein TadD
MTAILAPNPDRAGLPQRGRMAALAAGIAAIALLGGCSNQALHPDKMAEQSRDALGKGQTARALALAEAAVQADGRNAGLRVLLANTYLRAGRFESARQTYADAIALGDDSAKAALGLVLSDLALGRNAAALDTINTYGDVLPAADLGLALAMAGHNQRGIDVLTDAIRRGQNVPKVRQNLALAYALSGMWAEARIMAGQDVPADQVDARIQSWAAMARPEDARRRVASLLGAPLVGDSGQPAALALAHAPAAEPAKALAAAPKGELPPVAAPASAPAPAPYPSGALARIDLAPAAAAAPQAPRAAMPNMVSIPVVQPLPARAVRPAAAPVRMAQAPRLAPATVPVRALGSHLVQLGAFNSEETARRAWKHFVTRNPNLAGHPSLITQVSVRGQTFWRVQAAGFAGQAPARALCGTMRAHGGACLVMAVNAAAHVNGVQTAMAAPAHAGAVHIAPGQPAKALATR